MAKTILNEVIVTGTLEEVATEVKTDRNGKEYIGGKIVVNCGEVDGKANLIDLRVFTYKMTKSGTPSKLFTSYASLESYLHKRITVTAELREDNMYSQNTGKMLFFNGIYVKFVNAARSKLMAQHSVSVVLWFVAFTSARTRKITLLAIVWKLLSRTTMQLARRFCVSMWQRKM